MNPFELGYDMLIAFTVIVLSLCCNMIYFLFFY